MKVFILESHTSYEGFSIVGIWDSQEKAKQASGIIEWKTEVNKTKYRPDVPDSLTFSGEMPKGLYGDWLEINEYELNELTPWWKEWVKP